MFLETKSDLTNMEGLTINTGCNLRRIQNSVHSSGEIVLAISAVGEKGSDTLHGAHGVSREPQLPFDIPVRGACHFRTLCWGKCVLVLVCISVCTY